MTDNYAAGSRFLNNSSEADQGLGTLLAWLLGKAVNRSRNTGMV